MDKAIGQSAINSEIAVEFNIAYDLVHTEKVTFQFTGCALDPFFDALILISSAVLNQLEAGNRYQYRLYHDPAPYTLLSGSMNVRVPIPAELSLTQIPIRY